ncbi:MAG: InlB B-repeat-containing protein [Clostridiales bacterium]|nr:InlB B-repeat-containing protein [Clostridiales bacterium]
MKTRRLIAIILAFMMFTTTCCGLLLACSEETPQGNGVYTITFNANGGIVEEKSATTVNGKLSSLPTPFKENTEFLGWYLSSQFSGKRLTVDYKYSFSCVIHAKWGETQSNEYTVSFDPNGGTLAPGTEKMETVNGKLLAFPIDPTPPESHTFVGWFTEKIVGEQVDTDYEFTGKTREVTLYAHYREEFLITFDAGVGTITEKSRLTYNGKLMSGLPDPTNVPEDVDFVGWYNQKIGGKRVTPSTVFYASCTIYAMYLEEGEYIITLYPGEGTLENDIDELFTVGAKLSMLPTPKPRKGYEFSGWYTARTGGTPVDTDTVFTDSIPIFAQYNFVEYNITFDANSGNLAPGTKVLTTENQKLVSMPYRPFAPTGLRFVGWFTEKEGGVLVDTNYVFSGSLHSVTVYAHYETDNIRKDVEGADGLWTDDLDPNKVTQKGAFTDKKEGEVWAYDVNFREEGIALEIWYDGAVVTDVELDEYSTPKITLGPDKLLRLAEGADISNSIINVLYRFSSHVIYVKELERAQIQGNDGIYVESVKKNDITQNLAAMEVMAENVVIGSGGTKELTIVLGGKTVDIAHFGKAELVKAQLSSDRKNVIIAAGTYTFYYNYGATDITNFDYKKLWIEGESTGELPKVEEDLSASPYYMVGSSATLGLDWKTIASVSLIPENIHLKKITDKTFSITVDLYAGNEFKILKVGSEWNGAYDYTTLIGNTGNTKYFAESGDGNHNVVVRTSGNYTLTINTGTRKLSFVRNGEAEEVKVAYDIFIHGSFSGDWEDRLVLSDKKAGTLTFEFSFTEGVKFGFLTKAHGQSPQTGWADNKQVTANNTNGGIIKASDSDNLVCEKTGMYRFTLILDNSGGISSIRIDLV